jgi:hypothetical protein
MRKLRRVHRRKQGVRIGVSIDVSTGVTVRVNIGVTQPYA